MDAKTFKSMNFYERMGVKPGFTAAELKKSLKSLSGKYHPDRNPDPDAGEIMALINEANQTLSDPMKRFQYDVKLKQQAHKAEKAAQTQQANKDAANKAAKQAGEAQAREAAAKAQAQAAAAKEEAPKQEAPKQAEQPKAQAKAQANGNDDQYFEYIKDFACDPRFTQEQNAKFFQEWIKAKSKLDAEKIKASKWGYSEQEGADWSNLNYKTFTRICKTCRGSGVISAALEGRIGKIDCPTCNTSGLV